ncbi:MAG: radical SAM protein [Candidatus Lokiarchaeota archaeon]|nr:radical SAM protein [Candidatus Lokiarchaeota archaeon]
MNIINFKNTYCPDLWDGFTILKNGDIYSCCLVKPQKIGNIYQSNLKKLINNKIIKNYRAQSLNGNLECYEKCNFVRKTNQNFKNPHKIEIKYRELKRLHISFSEQCNIHCIMCKHPENYQKDKTVLDHKILIKNIDISPFENILIQGGEPLCIENCLKYLNYLTQMEKKYMLLTNGTLIDELMAKKLAKEAKAVVISINSATKETHEKINVGSKFEKVLNALDLLRKFRQMYKSDLVIFGRMTLTTENIKEIPLFLKKYKKLGFDFVNFGYDRDSVPQFLKFNPKLKKNLTANITRILNKSNLNNVDLQRLYQLNLVGILN